MPESPALAAARELLRASRPERAADPLHVLGEGWDHVSVLVGEDLVLRLPSAQGHSRLLSEARVLACVAGRLPLDVPRMEFLAGGTAAIYPLFEGVPADIDEANGQRLGGFLRALHGIPPADVRAAGIGWFDFGCGGRGWEDGLRRFCLQAAQTLRPHLSGPAGHALERRLADFLGLKEDLRFEACLIHGDLGPEHLLADPVRGRLHAVIDFGDAGLGDPAYDVRPEWTTWYRPVGPAFRRRQAFYRSLEPLHAGLHAAKVGDAQALRAAALRLEV